MAFGRLFELRHGPFGDLQREVNQLFDSLVVRPLGFGRRLLTSVFPPVNIHEKPDSLLVEIELPGVDEQSLELSVTRDNLSLKGERPPIMRDDETTVHTRERGYGSFSRAIVLPAPVDGDKAEATYASGVLSVLLPKAPEAMTRQVPIQSQSNSKIVVDQQASGSQSAAQSPTTEQATREPPADADSTDQGMGGGK